MTTHTFHLRPELQEGPRMAPARSYKAVGVALLLLGAAFLALGLSEGRSAFSIGGPALLFFGIVLLAQAKKRD